MRMSGLCKVEMSAFMEGRGPHGNGANHFEPARTGPLESVARGKAEAPFAGSSSRAAEDKRPPGAANAASDSRARGWCPGSRTTWSAIEPQVGSPVRAEDFGAPAAALCGFRTHAGCRAPGPGGFAGEPGDAAEVDDQGSFVGAAPAAPRAPPRVARAPSPFRRTGDAGQLFRPPLGMARPPI